MTRRAAAGVLAAMLTAVVAAGCGLGLGGRASPATAIRWGSATVSSPSAARTTVARAQRTHEIPTPAPAEKAAWGWRSPVQAVEVFAQWYINWTAATVATHMRVLARIAVGQARSAMTLAAGQVAGDSSLRLGGIANAGTVEAIAPVTGESNVYAVVTRERTTATHTNAYQGLRAGWHVTLATVTRAAGGLWTISGWQPEN